MSEDENKSRVYDIYLYLHLEAQDEEEAIRISKILCEVLEKSQRIVSARSGNPELWYDPAIEDNGYECDEDRHIGCYSYPNCDIDPNGCCILMGDDAEQYGHRD